MADNSIKAVDWQTLSMGCPVIDLAYFILQNVNVDVRRKHEDEIIKVYYEALVKGLKKHKLDV